MGGAGKRSSSWMRSQNAPIVFGVVRSCVGPASWSAMWSSASYTTSSPTPVSPLPCRCITVLRRVKSLDTSRSSPSSSYDSTSIGRSASLSKRATRRSLREGALPLDPAADHVDDVVALVLGERAPPRDLVVAEEAGATAGAGGMLSDEDGVATVGSLLAVLVGLGRGELLGDQV